MKTDILKYESKIWTVADDLRGSGFKESSWPDYMMPFFSLIMLEGRMLNHKDKLIKKLINMNYTEEEILEEIKDEFEKIGYNHLIIEKNITLNTICENNTNFLIDFENYLNSFDQNTKILLGIQRDSGEKYLNFKDIKEEIQAKGVNVLFNYTKKWSEINLRGYNNSEITTLEEHIKKKWADISAATSGEHYTPQDLIELITDLVIAEISKYQKDINWKKYLSVYDPTCGGGNMLFGVEDSLKNRVSEQLNENILTQTNGQEINSQLYALAKIESLFREESKIHMGNTLTKDKFIDEIFHIIVSNVPFGTDWGTDKSIIMNDKSGRFTNFPSTSDGQLLFLQHILSKVSNSTDIILNSTNELLVKHGFGFSVNVTNGSPLFSGDAGSGESNIRKSFLDNDNILALIQLPKDEFFNTGITTYLWLMTKNKVEPQRIGKIQLIDASGELFYKRLSKSKGSKRNKITEEGRKRVVQTYLDFDKCEEEYNKVFDNEYFYYNKQSIEILHKDINGKSIEDILPSKIVKGVETKQKSIVLNNLISISSEIDNKMIEIDNEGNISSISDFDEIDNETLQEKVKRLQEYVKSIDSENLIIKDNSNNIYTYDKKAESIVKIDFNGDSWFLGNGIMKVSISYKKTTKIKEESIDIKVELLPKTEKDYEVIPFQEEKQGKIVNNNIDDYLNQWVEQDYIKLDNVVGVEINFNKIFYKYEKLRSVDDIFSDIKELEKQELELDNNIFDLSPIELSEEELKSLES